VWCSTVVPQMQVVASSSGKGRGTMAPVTAPPGLLLACRTVNDAPGGQRAAGGLPKGRPPSAGPRTSAGGTAQPPAATAAGQSPGGAVVLGPSVVAAVGRAVPGRLGPAG
jgi:hypothetical protein